VIGIIVLLITIFLVFFAKNKERKKLTPLAGLALGFIISGMIFTDNRLFSYGLLGVGVILAVIDMVIKTKSK
jgi:ABC-type cobalamin transport system permease subunit